MAGLVHKQRVDMGALEWHDLYIYVEYGKGQIA